MRTLWELAEIYERWAAEEEALADQMMAVKVVDDVFQAFGTREGTAMFTCLHVLAGSQ
jgi:hypothetical protein